MHQSAEEHRSSMNHLWREISAVFLALSSLHGRGSRSLFPGSEHSVVYPDALQLGRVRKGTQRVHQLRGLEPLRNHQTGRERYEAPTIRALLPLL